MICEACGGVVDGAHQPWCAKHPLPTLILANGEPPTGAVFAITESQRIMAKTIGMTADEYADALLREGPL